MCHLKNLAFRHQSAELLYHLQVVIVKKIDRFCSYSNWLSRGLAYSKRLCRWSRNLMIFCGFYSGTTIAGVRELENRGFRAALMNAVIAGAERANELSKWIHTTCVFTPGWQWQCLLQFQSKQARDCLGSSIAYFKSFNYLIPYAWANASAVSS